MPATDTVVAAQTITHGVVCQQQRPVAADRRRMAVAAEGRGFSMWQLVRHLDETVEFVRSTGTVADELARYVRASAIDGLNLQPYYVPGGFDDVVPSARPRPRDRVRGVAHS